MNMTLKLRGIPEQIVAEMMKEGIAENKTEAVRIALLFFGNEKLNKEFRKEFVDEILERMKKEKPIRAKSAKELFE